MDGLPEGDFTESAASAEMPFAREFVTFSRQEHIQLAWESQSCKGRHQRAVERLARLECEYRNQLRVQIEYDRVAIHVNTCFSRVFTSLRPY